jgi:PAS domain S-box-containing protein
MTVPAIPLAAVPQPAFLHGADGGVVEANGRAEALAGRPLAGRSAAAVVGIFDLRAPDGTPLMAADLPSARALAGEEAVEVPLVVTAPGGFVMHVLASAAPLRAGDRVVGALTVWQDVSRLVRDRAEAETVAEEIGVQEEEIRQQGEELVRAFNDLDRQRRLLDGVLGALPHQVSVWDRDDRLVWANLRFAAERGFPCDALVGRTWGEVWGDSPMADLLADSGRAIAAGVPFPLDLDVAGPEGQSWRACPFMPIFGDSRLIITEDVTERRRADRALRESEAKYRRLVDDDISGDFITALDGRILDCNPAFARMFGFPSAGEARSANIVETYITPGEREALLERVRRERRLENDERFRRRRDGTLIHVVENIIGDFDNEGDLVGTRGYVSDDTQRHLAEEALREREQALQRSNEELQRFAYIASHDLQEPLRSIVSFTQLLERRYRGKLDTDADEFIAFIIEGGTRMQRLIEDLLQLSRVETKARPLEPTDVGEVVADALRLMETPVREAGATVTVDDLPVAMADASQLQQVVTNLVGNALKYRRPDVPPAIRISAERAGTVWRFAVADNGIGIEEEYFDRIFVIFQRLHTRDEHAGTGIGLAVVRKIIDRHGGRVWLESTPGEGSTFFFTLPAA